ncbi:alanine racemase [Streptococcus loxodontisalivarius]|uniref:Alanine racemase n=1 Tax=Streptococcus loxodontisalivarius TaxID=1349415 RepID=A0ABS2PQF8_9STRE|nr:alanine racemase [Streptococcus loxodontisalivarius]MBM7642111.1 alanine racemase [Streptococcus loxodontisalivarius]
MISSLHRPTVAKIDLEAITANIEAVKAHIPADKKTYAVVKANAYGHGAVEVAKRVVDLVAGFCVSNVDEALELRQHGITKEILILGVVMPEELDLVIANDLTIAVASLDWVHAALKETIAFKKLHVHIKVDSGMGRIGFRNLDETNQAMRLLRDAGVEIDGIFTHFATADEADDGKFNQQLAFFKDFLAGLEQVPALVHASNSATSLWHSQTIFNAVRLGIVCYGLNPSGTELALPYPLKPALQLESALVHVKKLEAGQDVGYGATYTSQEEQIIGTLPIGYADGWTRDMQGFSVLVEGQLCPIVGRVSMDQITIRLPKAYPLGTPVVLIGNSGAASISATDVASYRGTINYEVLCLLSDRIPRQYGE